MLSITYKIPVAKTVATPNFLCMGKCRLTKPNIGSTSIVVSEMMLIPEVAMIEALVSMHRPGRCGFHIFERGQQAKMKAMRRDRYTAKLSAIRQQDIQ